MDYTVIIGLLVFLLVVEGVVMWFLLRRREPKDFGNSGGREALTLIQNQIQEMARTLDARVAESSRQVHDTVRTQLGESAKLIREVTEGLTRLGETNRQVVSFADQLQRLQDVLTNPKQRGVLGEYYLETVLKNVLPPGRYQMQYKFPNGEIVDAVIFLDKERVLPIDSKFSLENYNRAVEAREAAERERYEKLFKQDLKNRIDETSKYIRPSEGTMDFAFMFIPSEGVYYDLLINQVGAMKTTTRDLIEYAFQQKRVIIVSPTSFMAYLQTVMQGLKALQIEESAKEIRKRVEDLGRHIGNFDGFMQKLGNALGTTVNAYSAAYKELGKIDKDVIKIAGSAAATNIEPVRIEKPTLEG